MMVEDENSFSFNRSYYGSFCSQDDVAQTGKFFNKFPCTYRCFNRVFGKDYIRNFKNFKNWLIKVKRIANVRLFNN